MDDPKRSQQAGEEAAIPPVPSAPSVLFQTRSPYRPLSRRRRQEQVVEPPSAVERPHVSSRIDVSPVTVRVALAAASGSLGRPILVWKPSNPVDDGVPALGDAALGDAGGETPTG